MASVANEPQAYFYLAHAEDLCDYNGDPIQVDVPNKSVILQSSVCGARTFWTDSVVDIFGDPKNKDIFTHPFKKTDGRPNLDRLNELLETTLEVHAADINIGIVQSKIYTIGYYRGEHRFGSSGVRTAGTSTSFEFHHEFDGHTISLGPFIRLFRGSVKPTEWEVHEYLNFTHPESERFKRDGLTEDDIFSLEDDPLFSFNLIDFVKEHPGIHYHLLCRDVPKHCKQGAAKRRALSAEVHGHSQKALQKVVEYAKELRLSNKNQDLEDFIRTMTVPQIKSFFNNIMYGDDANYRTDIDDCETWDSPVYLLKRIMTITKGDPAVYKPELIEAMKRCELQGDINELAEKHIKQEQLQKEKRRAKIIAKIKSKTRSKSKSKRKSKSRSKGKTI